MNRGGIKHRQRAALHRHQQANLGTAENDPFCALLRQRVNHLQVIIAGVVIKRAQAQLIKNNPVNAFAIVSFRNQRLNSKLRLQAPTIKSCSMV